VLLCVCTLLLGAPVPSGVHSCCLMSAPKMLLAPWLLLLLYLVEAPFLSSQWFPVQAKQAYLERKENRKPECGAGWEWHCFVQPIKSNLAHSLCFYEQLVHCFLTSVLASVGRCLRCCTREVPPACGSDFLLLYLPSGFLQWELLRLKGR